MTVKMSLPPRTMPDGVVLILNVRYKPSEEGDRVNPTIYAHAALKSRGYWYVTGSGPQAAGWGAVESWLQRRGRELVSVEIQTGTRTIWPEPVEVAVQSPETRSTPWPDPPLPRQYPG